jgi:hypothetical protein
MGVNKKGNGVFDFSPRGVSLFAPGSVGYALHPSEEPPRAAVGIYHSRGFDFRGPKEIGHNCLSWIIVESERISIEDRRPGLDGKREDQCVWDTDTLRMGIGDIITTMDLFM